MNPRGSMQRLRKELRDCLKHRDDDEKDREILLAPKEKDALFRWIAYLRGPPDTPFRGRYFKLRLHVSSNYPMEPPKVYFETKIFHPNVHFKTGEICLDILKSQWSPVWTLESTCRAIVSLMENPAEDSPLNCDAGMPTEPMYSDKTLTRQRIKVHLAARG
eukprot:371305_1